MLFCSLLAVLSCCHIWVYFSISRCGFHVVVVVRRCGGGEEGVAVLGPWVGKDEGVVAGLREVGGEG